MTTLYNDSDPFAANWLRELIANDHLPLNAIVPQLAAQFIEAFLDTLSEPATP